MISTPKLNFPAINLRAKRDNERTLVFDEVRSMYVVLTPEEWVRRHLVTFFMRYCGVTLHSIVEEYPVNLNNMAQRADVVVMDNNAQPIILAECKAPDVNLNNENILQQVYAQATRYNAVVQARYIVITNGLQHFCFEHTQEGYTPLTTFPKLG